MQASWIERAKQFKSRVTVVAGFLLRSRQTQARRAHAATTHRQRLRQEVVRQQRTIDKQRARLAQAQARIVRLQRQVAQLRREPPPLPHDPPLPQHQFGARMISLSVNLAARVGLRASSDVLRLVFDWLEADGKLPSWTTIRTWMLRAGVAAIEEPVEPAEDWIWMVDHSNQIGPEKVLAILGVRASQLPPPGQPLRLEDMRVLKLRPGVQWKREDMAEVYQELSERAGVPLAVLCDGAVELREGAEPLRKEHEHLLILGDFKHSAANVLKQVLGADQRFARFTTRLGQTRCAIQQTELAHFTPPGQKPKARFMNLAPTLRWASMVAWHLGQPHSPARRGITAARMTEKLGWLRGFQEDLAEWSQCQAVIGTALTFINAQGLFVGASRALLADWKTHWSTLVGDQAPDRRLSPAARQVLARLLRFVRRAEAELARLPPGSPSRLPLSTEILESSFGRFKHLERQHAKGGFTSLLAAYGCLLKPATAASIRRDFAAVPVKRMRTWVSDNLGPTLTSQRQAAYQQSRHAA